MGLVYVQGDAIVDRLKRHGRFTVPEACARSPRHFKAALQDNMQKMVSGFRTTHPEYRLVNEAFEWRGPLPHIEFSDSADVDPGPMGAPDPRDREACARYERAEKARMAQVVGEHEEQDLVDFQIVLVFERRTHGARQLLKSSLLPRGSRR
jgi:hypothetical protein